MSGNRSCAGGTVFKSVKFFTKLGFEQDWRDDGWMILKRDSVILEFFPHPDLNPAESWVQLLSSA